jgi:hypothetical protein
MGEKWNLLGVLNTIGKEDKYSNILVPPSSVLLIEVYSLDEVDVNYVRVMFNDEVVELKGECGN